MTPENKTRYARGKAKEQTVISSSKPSIVGALRVSKSEPNISKSTFKPPLEATLPYGLSTVSHP